MLILARRCAMEDWEKSRDAMRWTRMTKSALALTQFPIWAMSADDMYTTILQIIKGDSRLKPPGSWPHHVDVVVADCFAPTLGPFGFVVSEVLFFLLLFFPFLAFACRSLASCSGVLAVMSLSLLISSSEKL